MAAAAIGLFLVGLVAIGLAERVPEPAAVAQATALAARQTSPAPATPTAPRARRTPAAPEPSHLEVHIMRDGERLSTVELTYESSFGYSGFLTFSSRWWPRPPAVRVVWPTGDRERVLFQVQLSLGDPNRPGLPQDLASGQLRLLPGMRDVDRWDYRVQLEARQPNGLNVAIEVSPAFP